MIDQYFGIKELYEVVLKAKIPMQFGSRYLEEGEPVLYFENVNVAMLSERNSPIMARGGWSNMPRVIWEDRSEVTFSLTEGVMSSVGMSVLLSANMAEKKAGESFLVPKREGPVSLEELTINNETYNVLYLEHWPVRFPRKKIFIYEYERDVAQIKRYGQYIENIVDPWDETKTRPCIAIYNDKACTEPADAMKKYIVDYYYEFEDEALIYLIQKERFNGLFTLEGKFYSKDENDGINYTNLIYMPKVRVVSDINLRLGERADPTTSVFTIVGMPEKTDDSNNLIMRIVRLNQDIDADV